MHARWTHAADQSARQLQRENAEQEAAAEALQRQFDFQKAQLALFRFTADWSPCLPACSCLASKRLPKCFGHSTNVGTTAMSKGISVHTLVEK